MVVDAAAVDAAAVGVDVFLCRSLSRAALIVGTVAVAVVVVVIVAGFVAAIAIVVAIAVLLSLLML